MARVRIDYKNILKYRDIHAGESCLLLGNGPSLLEWLPKLEELSKKHTVIGINRSWTTDGKTAVFTAPYHIVFGHLHGAEIVAGLHNPPTVFTNKSCIISLQGWDGRVIAVDNRGDWRREQFRFDLERGTGAPFAGVFGIQVAAWMGFKRMWLLGYDLGQKGAHHFNTGHDGYNRAPSARNFDGVPAWMEQSGTEIYNANPDSAIRAFPFGEPD